MREIVLWYVFSLSLSLSLALSLSLKLISSSLRRKLANTTIATICEVQQLTW